MIPESLAHFSGNMYLDNLWGQALFGATEGLQVALHWVTLGNAVNREKKRLEMGTLSQGGRGLLQRSICSFGLPAPLCPFPGQSLVVLVFPASPPADDFSFLLQGCSGEKGRRGGCWSTASYAIRLQH